MKNVYSIYIDKDEFMCQDFHDNDNIRYGVEVSIDGKFIGDVYGILTPEVTKPLSKEEYRNVIIFNEYIKGWIKDNYINTF